MVKTDFLRFNHRITSVMYFENVVKYGNSIFQVQELIQPILEALFSEK